MWWFWLMAMSNTASSGSDRCAGCGEPTDDPYIPEPEGYRFTHCQRCCQEIEQRELGVIH